MIQISFNHIIKKFLISKTKIYFFSHVNAGHAPATVQYSARKCPGNRNLFLKGSPKITVTDAGIFMFAVLVVVVGSN